ncbi:MAG: single-stranded DNA-binding protein [Alphaproteobacteria bacterium]|nr:single-stranded DNA-binding protein [Alphaproteobacteria bacterium]
MAGSVNKVILVGNLGREPEIRHSNAGQKIASLSVATSDVWKDKSGQKQEKTEWHRVVIFNPNLADIAERFLHKGSKVYVEGALQTRKWTDQSGQEKYSTEIVIGNFKGELGILDAKTGSDAGSDWGASSASASSASSAGGWDSSPAAPAASGGDFDDEIPF